MGLAELFHAVKEVHTVEALRIHYDSAIREVDGLKSRISELEAENAGLLRELREVSKRLADYESGPPMTDIGPCLILRSSVTESSPGFYCKKCRQAMIETKHKNKEILHCTICQATFEKRIVKNALHLFRQGQ